MNKPAKKKSAEPKHSSSNTTSFAYFDKKNLPPSCQKDDEKIQDKCKPEPEHVKADRVKKKGGLLGKLKLPKRLEGPSRKKANWIDDHCEFLMIKPSSPQEMFEELKKAPQNMAEELGMRVLDDLKAKAEQKLEDAVKKKLAKMAVKQGIIRVGSFLLTPAVGIAVNILMTADGLNDLKNAAKEFPELKREIDDAMKKMEEAKKEIGKIQGELDKYKDPTKPSGYNEQKVVSDMMYGAAETNPCISARRCALVPFNQTHGDAPKRGKGCCPGQSGHHVLPSAMYAHCKNYKESKALTICVEGVNNSHGSHGRIHDNLQDILKDVRRADGTIIKKGEQLSQDQAYSAAAESVSKTFPLAGCNPECIKAQLKENYKKFNCRPMNESGASSNGAPATVGGGGAASPV